MAHPLLVVLGLLPAARQDSSHAARPTVSYHVTATVDERAGTLRGTVHLSLPAGDTASSILLDTGVAHLTGLRVGGAAVTPVAAAGGVRVAADVANPFRTVEADFESPATPRAGGTGRSRHLDFIGWLPRVLQSDGWPRVEPATFLFTLDVPADQVVAATGVPLCGDPGWAAARRPPGRPVLLRRDAYPAARDGAALAVGPDACLGAADGRKRIVWYAEDVRDVMVTMDPAFRYEEGDFLDRPVRALYLPGEERTWGAGAAVRRTETGLAWLHEQFDGPRPTDNPWPQTTAVHEPDGRNVAGPMLLAAASPDQETILRQLGRMYLAGAVAVAPADAAWLDQGLSRFQADRFFEAQGRRGTWRRLERAQLDDELDGRARPVLPARGDPREPDSAAVERSRFLLHRLRAAVGNAAMDSLLHAYWACARLRSAGESLFVALVDSVGGASRGEGFAASLRDATPVDYAVGAAHRERLPGGRWRTTVEVLRLGGGHLPLDVRVQSDSEAATVRAGGVAQRETVTVETARRPWRVVLDHGGLSHDWNVLNNRRTFGFHLSDAPASDRLDPFFRRPTARDRLVRSWAPLAWYNDAGGWTAGLRLREDYLGRFDLDELWATWPTGLRGSGAGDGPDGRLVVRNPTWLRSPGVGERLEVSRIEGRATASLGIDKEWGGRGVSLSLSWIAALTPAYLDAARWERGATLELTATGRSAWADDRTTARAEVTMAGGRFFPGESPSRQPAYARVAASAAVDRVYGATHVRARGFAGAALASGHVPLQRRITIAAADPYEQLSNPFLRSRGALLARGDFYYQDPGGAGLRGLAPALGARQAYGASLEVEEDVWRQGGGLARRVAVAAFGDGALADGDLDPSGRLAAAADAGVGLRMDHRIGTTAFQTRFDFPLWISTPRLAQDSRAGARHVGFRWSFSFVPSF